MKKIKKEINDPVTIYKFDAMEHENLEDVKIDVAPPKKVKQETIYLILAIVVKVFQYLSLLLSGKIRIFIFGGLLFVSWDLLLIARLKRAKWDLSKLVAIFFLMLLILDIALIFLIIK